jgi:carbamoyl-phosphate synthase small subunit
MVIGMETGYLVLSDGEIFEGKLFGSKNFQVGEVVFNTSMTGYQEVMTDPSYYGQIVTMTYPLIGNYGINKGYNQSSSIKCKGFIVRENCSEFSHWDGHMSLDDFLKDSDVVGLSEIDTRKLTKKIREVGCMPGIITNDISNMSEILEKLNGYKNNEAVMNVTTKTVYEIGFQNTGKRIAVMDFGIKQNIIDSLIERGFRLTVYPAGATAEEVLSTNPDGVFLSNGPGDPADLVGVIAEIDKMIGKKPMFGICLGHQLISLALGAKTEKLKYGHRGGNHPVKDLVSNKVVITSQNHGYVVNEDSLKDIDVTVTHINLNDKSIEGISHNRYPLFSVQYHPEAAPGPDDSQYLFDRFADLMK